IPSTQLPAASAPPTTLVSPTSIIQLVRVASQTVCSAATLAGPYALVGNGFTIFNGSSSAGGSTTGPSAGSSVRLAFFASVRFDGNGILLNHVPTGSSPTTATPLSIFQYTGTYTVNSDCTGTISLSKSQTQNNASGTPVTTTTTPVVASFVITNPLVQVN